ncbi:FRG domain-containing protein [Pelagibius marinus]|uniref:FRG domain-containing protein n=1 Tax=Pelagibius marinus TaxID=2762760 RepID=UPI00187271E1|nr:FRG domain-containing protein [Pelagibius marinus]
MEKIGTQKIWSYYDGVGAARPASNHTIRGGPGHVVGTYFQLANKVAELQFRNRDHVLLFRGQKRDHLTTKKNSSLKASLFRLEGKKVPSPTTLEKRFKTLRMAEEALVVRYSAEKLLGFERLKRHRILRWTILQHYEVCATPLLDVTQSLRIAASFASHDNETDSAFVFVFGVPNLSGAVTASSESGLQIIRLSSACPPAAVRPHIQEGYLLGEYPEITDYEQNAHYSYYEMDFGRRLLAKFRFNPRLFWKSKDYRPASDNALYPAEHRDPLLLIAGQIKEKIEKEKG